MAIRTLVGAAILLVALPAGDVIAQGHDQEKRTITLVGCVMRESQYRDMYGPGVSGPRGADSQSERPPSLRGSSGVPPSFSLSRLRQPQITA